MHHVDPTPSAPPITASAPPTTPSAPDQVTVALATHAGGLRAYHQRPGRPGGLGHPAAPTLTAEPSPRPRAADPPDPASPEACIDAHHRAAGVDHRAHRLDHSPRHRAAGPQRADHHGWTGQRPSAGHGWHDHEQRGVLDLWRHHYPAPGDRPDDHDRAAHHRADDDDHADDHDHAGHHDHHRAPHQHRGG